MTKVRGHFVFKTIRGKLLLAFALVGLFPLLALSFLYYKTSLESIQKTSIQSLERGALLASQDLDEFLNYNLRSIWAQAQLPEFLEFVSAQSKSRQSLEKYLNTLITILQKNESTFIKSSYILDAQGVVIFDSSANALGVDCVNCSYFKLPVTSASPQVQLFKNTKEEWELHFSTPIKDSSGHIVGVFGVNYGISLIKRLMKKYDGIAGGESFALVVDGQDMLITFIDNPEMVQKQIVVPDDVWRNQSRITINGKKYIATSSSLSLLSWKIWILQPLDLFENPIKQRLYQTYFMIFLILILALAVFFFSERWIAFPIRKLSLKIKKITTEGNLKERVRVVGEDEISSLGNEFNLLLDKIEKQMGDIVEKEQSFRVLFESSPDPLLVLKNGVFIDCNPAALKLACASSREELVGLSPAEISPLKQFDGRESKNIASFYLNKTHEDGTARFEWIHKRKDQSLFFVEVHLAQMTLRGEQMILCTWRDIEERKKNERDREIMLRELEAKNKEMESIVYVSSHDLRSPLVNVLGFGQRLEKLSNEINDKIKSSTDFDSFKNDVLPLINERMPSMIRFIQTSGKKMDALINGLLKLSRTGRVVLTIENLDMNAMILSIIESHKFLIEKLVADVSLGDLPSCEGDHGQINQIFSNLIDNALKYVDPSKKLVLIISGEVSGNKVIYQVRDTGKGIPKDHQDKIWNLFHRLDPQGPVPGEGLGLAFTHKIAERHGGKIWVESVPGVGSTFFVELPIAKG